MKEALRDLLKDLPVEEIEKIVGKKAVEFAKKESLGITKTMNYILDGLKADPQPDPIVLGRLAMLQIELLDVYVNMIESLEKTKPDYVYKILNENPGVNHVSQMMLKGHTRYRQLLTRNEVI
jgi:hypothetical protein